jgi:parallel beta-helix repeat protein
MPKTALFSSQNPGGLFAIEDQSLGTGSRFWVHSVTGSDAAGYGRSPDAPVATIDYAVGLCTASKGDIIYVMPGHNEGLGDAQIAVDVIGVQIIGLGQGSLVPRIDFDHANASIDISANGCTLKNLRLLPSVTTIAIGVDIMAAVTDTTLDGLYILPGEDAGGVDEFVLGIDIKAGCERTTIRNVVAGMHASAAHAAACISLTGASNRVTISNCDLTVVGAAAVAPISGITTLSTNVRINDCICVSDDEPGIELLTGTTGVLSNNKVFSNLASIAAAIVADGCAKFANYYVEVGNEAGALIGTASVDD